MVPQVESGTSTNTLDVGIEAMNLRGPVYHMMSLTSYSKTPSFRNSVSQKDDKFLSEKS